jgi:hypothetical protein
MEKSDGPDGRFRHQKPGCELRARGARQGEALSVEVCIRRRVTFESPSSADRWRGTPQVS